MKRQCEKCKKRKLWFLIKRRMLKRPGDGLPLKSNGMLCSSCFDKIKDMIKA